MDPVSLAAVSLGATAVGGGMSAFGSWFSGQAQKAQYQYQAGISSAMAKIAGTEANYDIASGEVKAEQVGEQTAANVARTNVRAGAGNVATNSGSTAAVRGSQIALGQQGAAIVRSDAAHAAYGKEVQGAADIAQARMYNVASTTAPEAADIGAFGSVASAAGSVAGKWYQWSGGPGSNTGGDVMNQELT